jgi:dUTP pyrophosphatase
MLFVKRLTTTAKLPTKAYFDEDAGYDFFSDETVTIGKNCREWIKTGIAIAIDPAKAGRMCPRSGLAGKGIDLSAGVIDSGYRGEVKVLLVNNSGKDFVVNEGDKIAQMLVIPVYNDTIIEMDELPPSTRGANGFGSSGV